MPETAPIWMTKKGVASVIFEFQDLAAKMNDIFHEMTQRDKEGFGITKNWKSYARAINAVAYRTRAFIAEYEKARRHGISTIEDFAEDVGADLEEIAIVEDLGKFENHSKPAKPAKKSPKKKTNRKK